MDLCTYRGHIRNWKSLCEQLKIDSNLPREIREKQIILKAYKKWGYEIGSHLNGMFAFSIWDEKQKQLFCIRDHFGMKSFYYYLTASNNLLVGTTIEEIMKQPGFQKELNLDMLQLYMSLTYAAGENTFFKGVKKLMPGHFLIWKNGNLEIISYFKPEYHINRKETLEVWADKIHNTVHTIIEEEKINNDYAWSFLSGGVDSAYLCTMSGIEISNSCGYDSECFDESDLAQKTSDLLNIKNIRTLITPEEYFKMVPYVMYHMEQPLGDASAIVFAIACNTLKGNTNVCYSGEGVDEFFGGYHIYKNASAYSNNLYVGTTNIMKENEKKSLLKYYNPSVLPVNLVENIYNETKELDPLNKMLNIDIQLWLEGDIFLNVDKMSKAAGIEIRMPLTDLRLFHIASQIPDNYKVSSSENKIAFRKAAAKVLPQEIAHRKKRGFPVPIRIWLSDARYNYDVKKILYSNLSEKFFHIRKIKKLFEDFLHGSSENWRKIWAIYTFLIWYKQYFTDSTDTPDPSLEY